MTDIRGRVLIIAGSDSGGGAGIQADLKAVAACGAYGATAITAITVQNTKGVFGVFEIPPNIIADQIRVVLEDIGADVIKTGMLHKPEVIDAVLGALDSHGQGVPLVVDPVMVAKGGARLLTEKAESIVRDTLLPRAALITPNIPEAEVLLGYSIGDRESMEAAARDLLDLGPRAVLLKGGHMEDDASRPVTDILMTADTVRRFESRRIETPHTHGTGCTLASAIAALLARGEALEQAVARARAYVLEAIRTAPGLGQGHGPLNHMHPLPQPETWGFPSMFGEDPKLV